MRGSKSHGYGSKKKHRGAGNRGGRGMAGSGKRADQKKTMILKKYGTSYFGKHGFYNPTKKNIRAINIEELNKIKKEKINLRALGYNKLLGKGNIDRKLIVNVDTILIGHSCGCAFLVRWLGETKRKVKKLILVAPWKIPYGTGVYFDSSKKFYDYNIDESIVKRAGEIIMFTADDEEEDGKKSLRIYHENLKGKVIELKNHGHYTFDDMGTEEFPELLEIVLK